MKVSPYDIAAMILWLIVAYVVWFHAIPKLCNP